MFFNSFDNIMQKINSSNYNSLSLETGKTMLINKKVQLNY